MRSLTLTVATFVTVGLLIAAGAPGAGLRDATTEKDEKAIRTLLRDLAEQWNKHEMKAFTATRRERRRRQSVWPMDERPSRDTRALDRSP